MNQENQENQENRRNPENRENPENRGNPENRENPLNPENPVNPGYPANRENLPPDDGLRRLLTWTFIALGITLVLAAIAVTLVIYFFDPGANW